MIYFWIIIFLLNATQVRICFNEKKHKLSLWYAFLSGISLTMIFFDVMFNALINIIHNSMNL